MMQHTVASESVQIGELSGHSCSIAVVFGEKLSADGMGKTFDQPCLGGSNICKTVS